MSSVLLQSVGGAPGFSTASYPATAGTSGNALVSDGTDWTSTNSISANFTFTSAVSGATETVTVSNTSDTASSAANILSQVAGSTAADPTFQSSISGGQAYTWGIDNSDSDAFVVAASSALGTTNVMRVATTGEINYPLQSCFMGVLSGDDLNATGDGTTFTLGSGNAFTEVFDQNGDFVTTGTYTCPVTSRVQLNVNCMVTGIGAGMTLGHINLVTSNRTIELFDINYFVCQNGSAQISANGSMLMDMDANDTASVTIRIAGGTKTADLRGSSCLFSGFIAC